MRYEGCIDSVVVAKIRACHDDIPFMKRGLETEDLQTSVAYASLDGGKHAVRNLNELRRGRDVPYDCPHVRLMCRRTMARRQK